MGFQNIVKSERLNHITGELNLLTFALTRKKLEENFELGSVAHFLANKMQAQLHYRESWGHGN